MKKRLLKRSLSTLLAVCMLFSMTAVGLNAVSAATAGASTGSFEKMLLDKMSEIRLRKACNAVVAISEAAEENGNEEIARVTGMIAEWGLMSAEEAATTKNIEICQQILTELNELTEITTTGLNNIESDIVDLKAEIKTTNLNNALNNDVDKVIEGINTSAGVLSQYDEYVAVAAKHKEGKATDEELQTAQYDFVYSLRSYLGITQSLNDQSLETLSKQVFGDTNNADAINQKMESIISTLSSKMVVTATDPSTVMSEAMILAYAYYPFSHQQYDFVVSEVGVQINTLVKVMCMYNEILALQSGYLNNSTSLSESDRDTLLNTYDLTVKNYKTKLFPASMENIDTMLSAKYTVDTGVVLGISDYMKSDDAVQTRLKINGYSKNEYIGEYNNYYRLMTHNGNTKNVMYLWAGDSYVNSNYHNTSANDRGLTNTYYSLKSSVTDGVNTFVMPPTTGVGKSTYTVNKYNSLLNRNVFALYGKTLKGYFHDYNDNNQKYNLINASYLFTPEYSTAKSGTEADFYIFDVNQTQSDSSNLKTVVYPWGKDSTRLTALYTTDSTFKQNLKLETIGAEGGNLTVTTDGTTVNNGQSATVESGKTLSIKVQVPKDMEFTLTCIRDSNLYDSSVNMTSDVVLLDDEMMKVSYDSEDSEYYYTTIEYTMPYSDTRLLLDVNEFENDSQGNILISSYDDLKKMSDAVNSNPEIYASKNYLVTNSFTVPDNSELEPIGRSSTPFTGTFDGQNYTIRNLNFKSSGGESAGLFAYSKGYIKNVVLEEAKVNYSEYSGGICGMSDFGEISNCIVKNSDISGGTVGGIVGRQIDTLVVKCANVNSNVKDGNFAGGITGFTWREYVNAPVTTVKSCYNTGTVTGDECGGIIGWMALESVMEDCYSIGEVKGTNASGALIGNVGDMLAPVYVNNCYYSSEGIPANPVGSFASGKTDMSTAYAKAFWQFKNGEVAYGLNKGATDGTQVWYQNIDNMYIPDASPVFTNNGENTVYKVDLPNKTYSNYEKGFSDDELDKDENGSFIIKTYSELCWVANKVNSGDEEYVNGSYIVANDITAPNGTSFAPIGTKDVPFAGVFDGQNYTISNLRVDGNDYVGLFGFNEGTIKNVNLKNSTLSGSNFVGGICGYSNGTISKCSFNGTVYGKKGVGGICGFADAGNVLKSFNSGLVLGEVAVGGVCGGIGNTIVNNCYNTGEISAKDRVGGIVGEGLGEFYIINCYNVGKISGETRFQPICGNREVIIGLQSVGVVKNCFYLGTSETDNFYETTFKTEEQFKSGEVAYLLNSTTTDGTQAWYQNIDNGLTPDSYPVLVNNDKNTVYKVDLEEKTYSNIIKEEIDPSLLYKEDLRTYQRILNEDRTLSDKSQIAMGYGKIDNANKVITVYMADTAQRMGVLMHQGEEGKKGTLKLKGDYPKYSKTSGELLRDPNFTEPDIYTDGNGCIFISQPDDGTEIPELTVEYTAKPIGEYESVTYALNVEIIDTDMFKTGMISGGRMLSTLSENDPDYNLLVSERGESGNEENDNKEEDTTKPEDNNTSTPDQPANDTPTDNGAVKTGDTGSVMIFLLVMLSAMVMAFFYRRRKIKE